MNTEGFSNSDVESLYEAFHRVHAGCLTAAIHAPFGRGADHAVLEGRNLLDKQRLKQLNAELAEDVNPRWQADGMKGTATESTIDLRG